MKINWKGILNLLLVIIISVYTTYYICNKPVLTYDEEYYKTRELELTQQRDSLIKSLNEGFKKQDEYKQNIDSLEKLKSKIKYVYVKKNNEIDSANCSSIISQFNQIFNNN